MLNELFPNFDALTVRILLACGAAFLLVILCGPRFIGMLLRKKLGEDTEKSDSETLNRLHSGKKNTPTMGGLLVIAAVILTSFFLTAWNLHVLVLVGATAAAGLLGMADDMEKLTDKKSKGMSARRKMFWLCLIGLFVGASLLVTYFTMPDVAARSPGFHAKTSGSGVQASTSLYPPFVGGWRIVLGPWGFLLFTLLVVVSTSNSVNLSDGLDGLAPGLAALVALTFTAAAYVIGRVDFADFLRLPYVPGAGEVAVVLAALFGALLGFLWFNAHPAQVFLGDTGSLSIGVALATSAVIIKQELLLPIAGGLFVVEALSVMLQVGSFKLTGKRIFRIAPIHHHFQFGGVPESKVTFRFWIVGLFLAGTALLSFKLRLP